MSFDTAAVLVVYMTIGALLTGIPVLITPREWQQRWAIPVFQIYCCLCAMVFAALYLGGR